MTIDMSKLETFMSEEFKNCSKCKENKPLSRFSKNDFGKPCSQCHDCIAKKSLERYHAKKLSQVQTSFAS